MVIKKEDDAKKAVITEKHYVTLAQVSSAQNTLTAYGKLIRGSEVSPPTAGISHPHGLNGPMQASLVFGVAIGGRCITLPNPEQIMLPEPDGPADGCGWDPSEYVVWKNLPKDWTTTHFQSQSKPLLSALSAGLGLLAPRAMMAAASAITDIGAQVKSIVQAWANMSTEPAGTAILQNLWVNSGVSAPFTLGAQDLAQRLNSQLGSNVLGSDITSTMTVDQLIDML